LSQVYLKEVVIFFKKGLDTLRTQVFRVEPMVSRGGEPTWT